MMEVIDARKGGGSDDGGAIRAGWRWGKVGELEQGKKVREGRCS